MLVHLVPSLTTNTSPVLAFVPPGRKHSYRNGDLLSCLMLSCNCCSISYRASCRGKYVAIRSASLLEDADVCAVISNRSV